jgi:hypothetical protein
VPEGVCWWKKQPGDLLPDGRVGISFCFQIFLRDDLFLTGTAFFKKDCKWSRKFCALHNVNAQKLVHDALFFVHHPDF